MPHHSGLARKWPNKSIHEARKYLEAKDRGKVNPKLKNPEGRLVNVIRYGEQETWGD